MTRRELMAMRDIADGLLESADGVPLGRVADIEIDLDGNGEARLVRVIIGPEALAGRVSSHLRRPASYLLRGRHEHSLDMAEIADFGPTLHLRQEADRYEVGRGEAWLVEHVLRFIPGKGHAG